MYEGWLSLAGTEIVNNERVRAYVADMVPGLQMPGEGCNGAPEGALRRILDDEPYRTPMLDDAPWVDPDDPDTYDFCGVFGLSVTGMDDSTRTATVTEHNTDGGGITGRRKGTRSVRVSALLIGVTQAAVEAGQQWLSVALEGDCDGDCNGSDLCYLQAVVDPQDWGDRVSTAIDRAKLTAASGRYNTSTYKFTPGNTTRQLSAPNFTLPLPCDEIVWTWAVSGAAGTQVRLHTYSETGQVFTDVLYIDSDGYASKSISDMGQGRTAARCSISLDVGTSVTVEAVSVEYRSEAKNSACFEHYMRQLRQVSPIDGPNTVTEYAPNNGAMRQVEFTLTSEQAYRFGRGISIVDFTDYNLTTVGSNHKQPVFQLEKTIPVPALSSAPTLVRDPACPVIPAPPRSNAAFTDCKPSTSWYVSYGVAIPGILIPLWHEAVISLSLFAGTRDARGVRVRFFPRPLGTFQQETDVMQSPSSLLPVDEYTACGQFIVDYIPADGWMKLDGQLQRARVKAKGKKEGPGDHLLSGVRSHELFEWPVLTCGTDYLMAVDVDGVDQSLTSLSLAVSARY